MTSGMRRRLPHHVSIITALTYLQAILHNMTDGISPRRKTPRGKRAKARRTKFKSKSSGANSHDLQRDIVAAAVGTLSETPLYKNSNACDPAPVDVADQ